MMRRLTALLAGIGMLVGLATFLHGQRHLHGQAEPAGRARSADRDLHRLHRRAAHPRPDGDVVRWQALSPLRPQPGDDPA